MKPLSRKGLEAQISKVAPREHHVNPSRGRR
jgi:hypothetical protein